MSNEKTGLISIKAGRVWEDDRYLGTVKRAGTRFAYRSFGGGIKGTEQRRRDAIAKLQELAA